MKVFVWKDLMEVSTNYHRGGGLMVVAESLERARQIIKEKVDVKDYEYQDPVDCEAKTVDPHAQYDLAGEAEERFFVFPDAGCC